MNAVVITGVSTGIGYGAATYLAERGFHVFGSVRNAADAARLSGELGSSFTPLLFDVTDGDGIRRAVEQVEGAVGVNGIRGLVNNAGICLLGPLMQVPEEIIRRHFEVNVFGLMNVTRAFLPLLGAFRDCPFPPGRIINLSSLSGRIAYPIFGVYAGTKFAVEAFSDSLRREMMRYGVRVSIIEPGAIKTPIWEKGLQIDLAAYEQTDYYEVIQVMLKELEYQRDNGLPVSRVSRVIHHALTARRPKTRYAIPNSPLTRWWIPKILPDRWLDFVLRHTLKLHRLPSHSASVPRAT